MELPFDIQRQIALELEPYDLIIFCRSNKNINREICNSNEFWRLKMEKDFPEVWSYFTNAGMIMKQPKNTYIRIFIAISKIIEKETDRFMYGYIGNVGLKNGVHPYLMEQKMERNNNSEMFYDRVNEIGLLNDQNVFDIKDKFYKVLYDSYVDYRLSYNYDNNKVNEILDKNLIKHNLQLGQLDFSDFLWSTIIESPLIKYKKSNVFTQTNIRNIKPIFDKPI